MDGVNPRLARFMMVKAPMTVRIIHLVVPLAHKATAMRIRETAGSVRNVSRAVPMLIGSSLRRGNVDSTTQRIGL
jgi:RNA-directed DNA polymerase